MRRRLRGVFRRLGVERLALAVRRRFLPAHVRADIRDNERLVALLAELLEPGSDSADHYGPPPRGSTSSSPGSSATGSTASTATAPTARSASRRIYRCGERVNFVARPPE
jgi:hypothetical protein